MAAFNLINDWLDNMNDVADMNGDTFKIALSNTAPGSEGTPPTGDGAGVLANVTQIAYTNVSEGSNPSLTSVTSTQTAGTYTFDAADATITASGGAVAAFRYVYIYDDTPTSPADPLVCYWDYGSALTLADGESLAITFNASGIYTIS